MIWANSEQNLSGSKAKYNAHVLYWLKSYKLWQKFKFRKMPRRKHLYFGVSQNGMIWHILAPVFYTCSGVDFLPPFTISGAHNIRILELGKHLTQEFELYNLYPVFLPVTQFARIWKMRNIFNCISHFLQLKKFLSEAR